MAQRTSKNKSDNSMEGSRLISSMGMADDEALDDSLESYSAFESHFHEGASGDTKPDEKEEPEGIIPWCDIFYYVSPLIVAIIFAAGLHYFFTDEVVINTSVVKETAQTKAVPKSVLDGKAGVIEWREHLKNLNLKDIKMFDDDQIKYTKNGRLFLVIAGHVFDVSEGAKMYGEDSGYHGFVGRDATRAFVSGKFDKEDVTSDIAGLDFDQLAGISTWIDFYLNHETYKFVGLHKGYYFHANGKQTDNMKVFQVKISEAAVEKNKEQEQQKLFPSCNMEWSANVGSKLWCSKQSGGVDRDWVGFPRIFKEDGKQERCACIHPNYLADPRVTTYPGCEISSVECKLKD